MAVKDTLQHVLFLAQHLKKRDPKFVVIVILMELNIATKSVGFEYLKRAILLFYHNPLKTITKEIYEEVALSCECSTGTAQVEHAIRHAIKEAWKNGDHDAFIRYFSHDTPCIVKKPPTNAEFISRIARILELWEGCCEMEADHE